MEILIREPSCKGVAGIVDAETRITLRLIPADLRPNLVRWESAPIVVAAFRRLEEMGLRISATYQGPPPRRPSDRYVITVRTTKPPRRGPMLFEQMNDNGLKRYARLITKHGEARPSEVERSGVGGNAAVHFYFPCLRGTVPCYIPTVKR